MFDQNDQNTNLLNARQEQILRYLQSRDEVHVAQLVEALAISEATVRRDLHQLGELGLVVRTFGGARLAPQPSLVARTFAEKRQLMREEKESIARAAARLVEPGMVVALDSGTTVWQVARALREKAPLTIITAALAPIEELGAVEGVTLHLAGGRFRPENMDMVGGRAAQSFKHYRADIAILVGDSLLPERGLLSADPDSAELGTALAACADRRVVVLDHSKFYGRGHCRILEPAQVDLLITDAGAGGPVRQELARLNYEVLYAKAE